MKPSIPSTVRASSARPARSCQQLVEVTMRMHVILRHGTSLHWTVL